MVITDRGQTLRFWKATQVRLNEETIRTFLSEEGWRNSEPWRSSFGPGGDRLVSPSLHSFLPSSPTAFLPHIPFSPCP